MNDYAVIFINYVEEIGRINKFVGKLKQEQSFDEDLIYRMVLSYAISIMDAFLGNTFRYYIKTYPLFRTQYMRWKIRKTKISETDELKRLEHQSFQNLAITVIPYYKHAFGIEIPLYDIIQKAVNIRNSVVHNNGREKDGYKNEVTLAFIEELIPQIEKLVIFVYQQMIDVFSENIVSARVIKNSLR